MGVQILWLFTSTLSTWDPFLQSWEGFDQCHWSSCKSFYIDWSWPLAMTFISSTSSVFHTVISNKCNVQQAFNETCSEFLHFAHPWAQVWCFLYLMMVLPWSVQALTSSLRSLHLSLFPFPWVFILPFILNCYLELIAYRCQVVLLPFQLILDDAHFLLSVFLWVHLLLQVLNSISMKESFLEMNTLKGGHLSCLERLLQSIGRIETQLLT